MKDNLELMQHALGLDKYGRGELYRNCFVTGKNGNDYEIIKNLIDLGFMAESNSVGKELLGGSSVFIVTSLGIDYVRKNSPKPTKKTLSHERYIRYLDVKGYMPSFIEFCRYDAIPQNQKEEYCRQKGWI